MTRAEKEEAIKQLIMQKGRPLTRTELKAVKSKKVKR